jgi:hypothetical protein
MTFLTGDLGPTLSYTRREYAWLSTSNMPDGRDGTLWLNHSTAKKRSGTKFTTSRYGVGEVRLVGFNGRAWVFHKELGLDEHGPSDREPPYTVKMDRHGEIWCQCMADSCDAPCCRHCDSVLELLAQGEFAEAVTTGA